MVGHTLTIRPFAKKNALPIFVHLVTGTSVRDETRHVTKGDCRFELSPRPAPATRTRSVYPPAWYRSKGEGTGKIWERECAKGARTLACPNSPSSSALLRTPATQGTTFKIASSHS